MDARRYISGLSGYSDKSLKKIHDEIKTLPGKHIKVMELTPYLSIPLCFSGIIVMMPENTCTVMSRLPE